MPVCKSTPEIARIFQQIATGVSEWKRQHSVSRMIANLNQLFVSFLDMPVTQKLTESSGEDSRLRVVELFLKSLEENRATCQEIKTLQDMATICGMGITSLAKYTRASVNVGPMEFLRQCRLNHAAQQMCKQPGASITEIGFSNGFNSSQYFATCFRKQFKMSPSEFVSRQRLGLAA
jgi:AraC family L-rhamnose operon regulatory protein RhaS